MKDLRGGKVILVQNLRRQMAARRTVTVVIHIDLPGHPALFKIDPRGTERIELHLGNIHPFSPQAIDYIMTKLVVTQPSDKSGTMSQAGQTYAYIRLGASHMFGKLRDVPQGTWHVRAKYHHAFANRNHLRQFHHLSFPEY